MIEMEDERAEAVTVSLLGSAEGSEAPAIMRAAVRAGLMWRCGCRQANYPSHETCVECREPRRVSK
ncbi:hypothetical protein [Nonomuraea zeae]|uniref:RanBP2-type domain-containing protein n=1 Tax=Nonomuraea zeae TaxID=1642303 RepID=A0A5S4FCV2_9ACTN|nr:hypothetical protein [Nonomuraea zeae]TMR15888.1 hypothetical protein ETD85_55730 [Nonomuraea zeae]